MLDALGMPKDRLQTRFLILPSYQVKMNAKGIQQTGWKSDAI